MPFNASILIAAIGLVLALAVWIRTKRIGPVMGVLVSAFVIMAFTDPAILTQGGQAVADGISWLIDTVLNF